MLRKLRKENRYTLKQFAALIGVSNSLYEKVEYGIRRPSRAFLEKLKKCFPDFDLNELIIGKQEKV